MSRPIRCAALLCLALTGAPLLGAEGDPYSAIDRHALQAPEEAERSVKGLAKYLVEGATNDRQKARAIYRWVTDRIAYDVDAYLSGRSGDSSPAGVLRSRKSVCEGYANLFRALCREAGVAAVKVPGRAKGIGYATGARGGHAWNAVRLGGKWQLIDATWGAGVVRGTEYVKLYTDYYFLTPPEQFVFTHLPNEARWQLLTERVSAEAFKRWPRVDQHLFQLGVKAEAVRKVVEDPDFQGLVNVYAYPGKPIKVLDAPLEGHLKAGEKYHFRIEAESFNGMAIESGGRWRRLARKGKVFEGTITAPSGKFTLRGLKQGDSQVRFWAILEYVGE